ncbi:hypothetical protein [Bdellovibrio sp. HCB2-146]|uniref:hypothetical protein n=1 Tax=Bdellovibrio sp. HCB2-146 TaxID=3394362 RepID=UPI0039BD4243
MGIGDKMKGFATNVQGGVKSSSMTALHIFLRLMTGLALGLTIALIGQEFVQYGTFALIFCMIVVLAVIMKTLSGWSIGQILIFDLICILVAMLLRMYILVAP